MAIHYYKEPNGDYLAVNMAQYAITRQSANPAYTIREGRASCISGLVNSVCTTGISGAFLLECERVPKSKVPKEWLKVF